MGQTDRQTDRHQTDALRFSLDAASVINACSRTVSINLRGLIATMRNERFMLIYATVLGLL